MARPEHPADRAHRLGSEIAARMIAMQADMAERLAALKLASNLLDLATPHGFDPSCDCRRCEQVAGINALIERVEGGAK